MLRLGMCIKQQTESESVHKHQTHSYMVPFFFGVYFWMHARKLSHGSPNATNTPGNRAGNMLFIQDFTETGIHWKTKKELIIPRCRSELPASREDLKMAHTLKHTKTVCAFHVLLFSITTGAFSISNKYVVNRNTNKF